MMDLYDRGKTFFGEYCKLCYVITLNAMLLVHSTYFAVLCFIYLLTKCLKLIRSGSDALFVSFHKQHAKMTSMGIYYFEP